MAYPVTEEILARWLGITRNLCISRLKCMDYSSSLCRRGSTSREWQADSEDARGVETAPEDEHFLLSSLPDPHNSALSSSLYLELLFRHSIFLAVQITFRSLISRRTWEIHCKSCWLQNYRFCIADLSFSVGEMSLWVKPGLYNARVGCGVM